MGDLVLIKLKLTLSGGKMGDLEAARRLGGSTKFGRVKLSSILAVVLLGIILFHTLSTSSSSSLSSSSKPCSSVGSRDVVAVSMVTVSRGVETVSRGVGTVVRVTW